MRKRGLQGELRMGFRHVARFALDRISKYFNIVALGTHVFRRRVQRLRRGGG